MGTPIPFHFLEMHETLQSPVENCDRLTALLILSLKPGCGSSVHRRPRMGIDSSQLPLPL
jgi:hypothetical protein